MATFPTREAEVAALAGTMLHGLAENAAAEAHDVKRDAIADLTDKMKHVLGTTLGGLERSQDIPRSGR